MKRLPPVVTEDAAAYWEGLRNKQLLLQTCQECGAVLFPHRAVCTSCGSRRLAVIESQGRATVYSYTVVHRAPAPEFQDHLPYVVALVDLDEGPRMMTNLLCDVEVAEVGMRVAVEFDTDNEQTFPVFRPLGGQ